LTEHESGGDAPPGMGQVKWDFSGPSRWELVQGWKGNLMISKATVRFQSSDEVRIEWHAATENAVWGVASTREYRHDPQSGLPVLSGPLPRYLVGRTAASFRMVGNNLEVKFPEWDADPDLPPGTLRLLLKRVP
jgi:hypothetical protein